MRLSQTPQTLISLMILLSHTDSVKAVPTPKEVLEKLGYGYMEQRDLSCGESGQYTCTGAEACYTNAAQIAYCSVPGNAVVAGGSVGYATYTTVYTETDLVVRTSTYTSSWYQGAATTSNWIPQSTNAICDTSLEQTSCGAICCASNQVCAFSGSCAPRPSSAALTTSWTYIVSTMSTTTMTYSAPLRPTSGTVTSGTSGTVTSTGTFIPVATATGSTLPVVSSSTSHGLSGGAIAGIVIGTIAGIILLLLICFCCIVKAGFDGLLALFGLGSRRNRRSRERVEVVEERYSRHGSGASRRDTHTGWFGAGGRPATVVETRKKKSSGFGGLGAVGAGLLGLAAILGLKRRHDRKEMVERTDISSSYYTDSLTGTSASSASSDRRTRQSRQSRGTRR